MKRPLCAVSMAMAMALTPARADAPDASAESVRGCVETIPPGASRPVLSDVLPSRGLSGYATTLVITVHHGKGERVLPGGLELQQSSDAAKALKEEGWVIPDQDGGAAARLTTKSSPAETETTIELPLLALPKTPGRHELRVPPLPIAVARANGDLAVVCTHMHFVTVEDPIASADEPKPMANPPPRQQREEWTALRNTLIAVGAGALIGAIAVWLLRRWGRRPKPAAPPAPPRPPWEVALERLHEIKHAGLIETARLGEFVDRVSDALRAYLGARYGFDGLESTTDEIVSVLGRAPLGSANMVEIAEFLQVCDLVKFANMTPSAEECAAVLASAEHIVRATMPAPQAPDDARPATERAQVRP